MFRIEIKPEVVEWLEAEWNLTPEQGTDLIEMLIAMMIAHKGLTLSPVANAAPDLLEACNALLENETSSYCERCQRHAPKDHAGYLIGPIPHIEGCAVGMAQAAIAKAEGKTQ